MENNVHTDDDSKKGAKNCRTQLRSIRHDNILESDCRGLVLAPEHFPDQIGGEQDMGGPQLGLGAFQIKRPLALALWISPHAIAP